MVVKEIVVMGKQPKGKKALNKNQRTVRLNTTMQRAGTSAAAANARSRQLRRESEIMGNLGRSIGQARANSIGARAGQSSQYLKCLVNPEEHSSCYPDTHTGKTALCTFIFNGNLFVDANKKFFASINPTLNHHIIQQRDMSVAATPQFVGTSRFTPAVSFTSSGTDIPCRSPVATAATIPGLPSTIYPNNYGTYVLPALSADSTGYINTPDNNIAVGYKFDTGGSVFTTSGTAFTIPQATKSITIHCKANAANSTADLTQVTLSLYLSVAAGSTNVFQYDQVTDYGDLVSGEGDIFEEYRVVGMSALVTFQGNTLQDGGNIAARALEGGENAFELQWTTYEAIASLVDSYEAPLKKGAYGFWTPTDEKDMNFRSVSDTNDTGDLPSLVVAGTVPDAVYAKVRLRVAMVVEAKSYKPFVSILPRTINPAEILQATIALKDEPRWSENPKHKSFIARLINSARQYASQAYGAYQQVAPVALPLAKMAAAALL